ncbi:hypothetical protein VTN77DRAFT_7870 [Rasamsonia byssochlamydoides]|uniref:uncharacterized protein n=1 Tax=Rasamsonia byssochlamydoides TaxID=89139 RepID=UPI0037448109
MGTVSWAYNWDLSANGDVPAVDAAISAGSRFILGFNEPDDPQQANMSPSDAATEYQQYVRLYDNG